MSDQTASTWPVPQPVPEGTRTDQPTAIATTQLQRSATDIAAPTIPEYDLLEVLGEGGMGTVWKARHAKLHRVVALKVLHSGRSNGSKELIRFLAEAEAVASITHRHVVQVYEYGEHQGRPFLALELLPGGTLAERLKTLGRLAPAAAAVLLAKVARGVSAAHELGIVHRDLKPANVLFDAAGEPKVADFGLAKRLSGSELTATQAVMGTPAYMAPEQAGGQTKFAGPPADVWALGVILYECLTGQRPFDADDPWCVLHQVQCEEPLPLRQLVPEIPRDLELICHKCLAKDPAERYATAAALADDLQRWLDGEPVSVRPTGLIERAAKWAKRKPTLAVAYTVTALAVFLAGLSAGAVWLWQRAEHERFDAIAARDELARQKIAAELARDGELEARKKAEQTRDELAREREKLAVVEYGRTMQVAYQEWRENNVGAAMALLAGTRPDLRGWEYHHVHRICNPYLLALRGHTAAVNTARFSPDGQQIVTASDDSTVRVWDAATGQRLLTLLGHTNKVASAAFSPDGRRIVTASWDYTAQVWDAQRGARQLILKGHTRPVLSAAFSPDGRRIVTTSQDRTVRVWDANKGTETLAFTEHADHVHAAIFSPDGLSIASASEDGSVRVWDASTGAEQNILWGHVNGVITLAFNPNGTQLATGSWDQTARIWDASTGVELAVYRGHAGGVRSVAFSPDGVYLITGSDDNIARIWDTTVDTEPVVLRGHASSVRSVAFSSDMIRILTASDDGTARLWDTIQMPAGMGLIGHTRGVLAAAFSPDGQKVVTGSEDHTTRLWDATIGGREPSIFTGHAGVIRSVTFSPDGRWIVTGSDDGTAKIWEANTGAVRHTLRGHHDRVRAVAFSPDGLRILTTSEDRTAKIWDAASGVEQFSFKNHTSHILSAAFAPDGQRVVTAGWDGLRIWDTHTGTELVKMPGHAGGSLAVTFSPDGSRVLTGGVDCIATVWDAATGVSLLDLRGHTGSVKAVAFSPDGKRMITGSDDRTVRIWDAGTGAEVYTLRGHSGPVLAVAFSPDGRRIVTGSWDQTVMIWESLPIAWEYLPREAAPYPQPSESVQK
jgi:WD40 repeat protein/tRNA A-37 threonylcarbamoyl transferase component Bud32